MLPENSAQAQPTSERRKYPRVRLTTKAKGVVQGHESTLLTRDVSVGGLLIDTKKLYPYMNVLSKY